MVFLPLIRIWFSFFSHVVSCSLTARDLNITRKFPKNKLDNIHLFIEKKQKCIYMLSHSMFLGGALISEGNNLTGEYLAYLNQVKRL